MLTLVLIKAVADLALYYAFAGFFAALFGASGWWMLLAMALQAASLTLSYVLRGAGRLRFLPLGLAALCWAIPGGVPADWLVILPPTIYLVLLIARKTYAPEWRQQARILSLFWKIFLAFAVIAALFNAAAQLSAAALPFAVLALSCSVLLTRSLRHDPEVYCQPRYQAVNLLLVCAVVLLALPLSSEAFWNACLQAARLLFQYVIITPIAALIHLGVSIARWLMSLIPQREPPPMPSSTPAQENTEPQPLPEPVEPQPPPEPIDWTPVLIAVGVIAAVVISILLFRALLRRGHVRHAERLTGETRTSDSPKKRRASPGVRGTPAARVRAQYKKFLKLARSRSCDLEKSDTSLDISEKCRGIFDPRAVDALRKLYLPARYNDSARQEDAQQAKQLYENIKRSSKH